MVQLIHQVIPPFFDRIIGLLEELLIEFVDQLLLELLVSLASVLIKDTLISFLGVVERAS